MTPIKLLLTTAAALAFALSASAQEPKANKKISIRDFYIQSGFSSQSNTDAPIEDFRALAPQSELLKNDMSGFSPSTNIGLRDNNAFALMVALQFRDGENAGYKKNPLLRLGFSYTNGRNLSGLYYREDRVAYDTLTSSQTGQAFYIDSVTTQQYSMRYASEQLRIDGSLLFRTNPEARWSLYAGLGIAAGISLNSNTEIMYNTYGQTTSNRTSGSFYANYGFNQGRGFEVENHRNQTNISVSPYVPLGVDFRVGNKREAWKAIHLFYEMRPSVTFTSIPELRTIGQTNFQHFIGLRVSWS